MRQCTSDKRKVNKYIRFAKKGAISVALYLHLGGRPPRVKVLVAGTGYQVVAITLEMVVVAMSLICSLMLN